ncbi:hypothetical protein Tco_0404086 [Tanacetum coccineum]
MVAYLEKSEGSEGFHEIIDFLSASHIHYALTASPTIYTSLIEQFWQTTTLCTIDDGVLGITTTIDRKVKITVSEGSIRRHLKLEDSEGIPSLLTAELFEQLDLMGNMKRVSKGYSGVITPLFDTMLVQPQGEEPSIQTTPETSPSKITSSPSLSSHHTSISAPSTSQPPITTTEEASPMPHESPLQSVHSLGRDEGKARRRARIVILEDEDAVEDSSKQGRKISDIDTYPTISLVQPQQDIEYDFDATASIPVTIAGLEISTANIAVSTADAVEECIKSKGKAIIQESKPSKKIKKRVQVQMSVDEELAKKVFEEEQARFNAEQEAKLKAEQEQERIDFETTLELQRQLDEREEVSTKEAYDIDWSDPSVLRYHALQNRRFSVSEVRKNMFMYLKHQGGYKMSHFKGMSYEEIRPIIERVRDQIQSFVPMDSEKEKDSEKKTEGRLKRAGLDVVEEPAKRQKTIEASESVQEQPS